ncbi:MAG TPA: MerR family transcriptional regulator [Burkholderiaceae bacterium]|jgi:hypothetical protein|nr:MerR family transcriptional regulator [Burkholderiaceae bacterium]
MNITLSIDERVAERARQAAQAMGKSLNQAVRDHLEQLAGMTQQDAQAEAFEASARASPGRLNGWQFDRDEANARR